MVFLKFFCDCMFFSLIWINFGSCQDFGYDGSEGPNHWGDKYAKCIGKHQSPINIDAQSVTRKKFPTLIFEKFDKPLDLVSLENNGHTVVLKIQKGEIPAIRGGPLSSTYKFAQLHFHWGPNDTLGSENQINHHPFPVELHMVMYNSKYPDFNQALNFKEGLTVLAFLFSATNKDNSKYDAFEAGLHEVQNMSSTKEISNFVSLDHFTTDNRNKYFTYEGSLTTPPCSEVVIWIEFIDTIPLSKVQIKAFRSLLTHSGPLTHNFRPVQPVYDRIIYMNSVPSQQFSTPKALVVILTLVIALFRNSNCFI